MNSRREYRYVGKSVPSKDGAQKVCGTLVYPVDFALPGMVYGKILRSSHAHARIIGVDCTRAAALPGVLGIVTHADAPDLEWHGVWNNYKGHVFDGVARFVGDEIGAVAAVTPAIAAEALALIEVEYELLPSVFDLDEALGPDAPQVHDEGNRREPTGVVWGDVEAGESEARYVVSADVKFDSQQMCPVGRNAAIAQWSGDRVTLYTGTQTPSELQDGVAQAFGLPRSKVRIIGLPTAGSFGLFWSNNFMMVACLLARKVRRPVKIELTNEECIAHVKRRHREHCVGKMGCTEDGEITFIDVDHVMDNGAYGFKDSVGYFVCDLWGARSSSGRFRCRGVSTNLVTAGCMRGVGDVTMGAVVERMADQLAAQCGIDPVEFRVRNLIRRGDPLRKGAVRDLSRWTEDGYEHLVWESAQDAPMVLRKEWPKLFHLTSGDCASLLRRGAREFNWETKFVGWGKPYATDGSKCRAVGVGDGIHMCGEEMEGVTDAVVHLHKDGSATLCCSCGRQGTGTETTQAQVAAETLGIPVEMIEVQAADTDACPWSRGSVASTTMFRTGFKTWAACLDARRQLLELAAREFFDNDPSKLDVRDGIICWDSKGQPSESHVDVTCKTRTIEEVMTHHREDTFGPTDSITGRPSFPMPPSMALSRHFAVHFAEVEVDLETGKIALVDYLAAQDSGTVVNPAILASQMIGGAVQGSGFALVEGLRFDHAGRVMNASLADYKVLRMTDFPIRARTLFGEDSDPVGPFGARSGGEGPIAAAPAAVAQAVYNATGVWVDFPMTPENVLRALKMERAAT